MASGFLKVGVSAFGGALPWLRRVVVEERQWLDEREFADMLTICQAIPGPNVVNCSVFLGTRWYGVSGGLLAFVSLIAVPLSIVLTLALVYEHLEGNPRLRAAVDGMAVTAIAYLTTMALAMAKPFYRKWLACLLCACALALSLLAGWSMGWVLLAGGAVGVISARRNWL
jgi:chromate transporter